MTETPYIETKPIAVNNWSDAEQAIREIAEEAILEHAYSEHGCPGVAKEGIDEIVVRVAQLVTDNFCVQPKQ